MKTKVVLSCAAIAVMAIGLEAQEEDLSRDRFHSVKKAVGSVGAAQTKELDIVHGVAHMFRDGKVAGQIRSMYSGYDNKTYENTYSTAIGGFLKYELAQYKGFSGAVSFHTSTDIDALSGDGAKRNSDLSSSDQEYLVRSQSYINYKYDTLNVRVGRQIIDTPLADSDDIYMIPNTFNAAVVTYEVDAMSVIAGYLESWQGIDAGLDDGWQKTGADGTYFGGLSYSDKRVDANFWIYAIRGEAGDATANDSFYGDLVGHYHLTKDLFLHAGVQYLKQNEQDNSGVAASIVGVTTELVIDGLGFNVAYNHAAREANKQSFSGFGGGTLFTSMDSMILDAISYDRSVNAYVVGVSYEFGDYSLFYAYGDFRGDADSSGQKAEIAEHNIALEYTQEDLTLAAIYTVDDDKYDDSEAGANGGDWANTRLLVTYNF